MKSPRIWFTRWRVPPTIAARSDWVSVGRRAMSDSTARRGLLGEPRELEREAAGEVEEMDLGELVGQAPEPVGDSAEELPAERVGPVDQRGERGPGHGQRLGRLDRGRGRGSDCAVEQHELAERVARPRVATIASSPSERFARDLDPARRPRRGASRPDRPRGR